MSSPKHNFLSTGGDDDEDAYWDGLIRIQREEYKPGGVAKRVHMSLAKTRLNTGGLGSGKTRTMVEHLNNMCLMYPGGHVILARKFLDDLKRTALVDYLEKAVTPETIDRFNSNEGVLYYRNGSRMYAMETKTPSNFKSMEIIAYGIEEADENEEGEGDMKLMTVLNGRLRQKIYVNGKQVPVPYAGFWTYNPVTENHWLARLEDHPSENTEVFRSTTYDNAHNLPATYITDLMKDLAPWEIRSLIFGERAMRPKGKPVIHGFGPENIVALLPFHHLPMGRGWDFGFNNPAAVLCQYDPEFDRALVFREICGQTEQLKFFAPRVKLVTQGIVGPLYPTRDFCDPHGEDQKDVGDSSVEHLRLHHGIHCLSKRTRIKTGLDEIQELTISRDGFKHRDWVQGDPIPVLPKLLVDPSCRTLISALSGGYHRDAEGIPVKDGVHDHIMDAKRYWLVHARGEGLARRMRSRKKSYIPRCALIGV
jgi:hypothetical protein